MLAVCALAGCVAEPRAEPRGEPGSMPGPARGRGRPGAAAVNALCEGCHEEVAREWRGSLHRRAYVDRSFAESLAREPDPFCRGCHAPEADPQSPPPPAD